MFSSILTSSTLFLTPSVIRFRPVFAFQRKVVKEDKKANLKMTITPDIRISNGQLVVKGRQVLTGVPSNVVTTSSASDSGPEAGIFIGASFDEASSRHVVSLGAFTGIRFMASFRFKLWWMAQRMGDKGSQIPYETQFLIMETDKGCDGDRRPVYTVFLPLVEGSFRACLQGNETDALELCVESGDFITKASFFTHSLFVSAGTDPFATITNAIRSVKLHSKTFRQRHEKKLPGIVDYFGWCTWDAFYQEVTQQGVEQGLESLAAGGTPPKFVIIDDGWQSVEGDQQTAHPEPLPRLTGIKENSKFQTKDDPTSGINNIVRIAKEKHGLKHVYVWHAITGYWGGVRPGTEVTDGYDSLIKYPKLSKGVMENEPTWKTDVLALQGLGLVNPKNVHKFYDELHSYLASAGVDGVKVDVQCILETLGTDIGGRVELTKGYHRALDSSIAKNFPDNGCIACMSHSTDALYCSKQTAVIRASDDFYPRDPVSHTIHIASVAYNSVFLGEFMVPDWDMFHSLHPAAEYHASARAISGGPVYVSDAPGKHNFDVLRKLVLPDGSVLRALLPGRPTQDCLFSDPARDGTTLLKIWNMNKYTGVIGIYNCQGAAWNLNERKNTFHQTSSEPITSTIRNHDVHLISEAATDPDWNDGDCAIYCHRTGYLKTLQSNASLQVTLNVLQHEIYTVTPIKVLATGISFAPIGLINMYNAGGAIDELRYQVAETGNGKLELVGSRVYLEVKGCGTFGAYSSRKARRCSVDSVGVDIEYDSSSGLLSLSLKELPKKGQKSHVIEVEF